MCLCIGGIRGGGGEVGCGCRVVGVVFGDHGRQREWNIISGDSGRFEHCAHCSLSHIIIHAHTQKHIVVYGSDGRESMRVD